MHRIHLNFGSNKGNRMAVIGRAVALVAQALRPRRMELSDYVESDPAGFVSSHRFLNRGALLLIDGDVDPLVLLDTVKAIEKAMAPDSPHRNPDGSYRDRVIDIDIIDVDHISYSHPRLRLPHPRLHERPFVLGPLAQLDPYWR